MARVLLTDAEQRSCLAATRSLGRAGHEVLVCSSRRFPLAGASRYCRGTRIAPDPTRNAMEFVDGLRRLVDADGVEVLIPMTDVSASLALRLRESHPRLVIPFPPAETYQAVSDKQGLLAAARELGIPTPGQHTLESRDEGMRFLAEASDGQLPSFPLIVKPARSAVVQDGRIQKLGVLVAESLESLLTLVADLPDAAFPLLLQEKISGPGLGAFTLFWEGRAVAWSAHERLREKPPTGGVSVYRESVPLREDLKDYSTRLLSHFAWSGVAMVEFKEDASTGTPYLMEVNGRFWGSLQLAIDSGVDFPALLVDLALGRGPVSPGPYRTGLRSRWLWGDIDHLLWLFRHARKHRATHPDLPGALASLPRILLPWRPGDRFEVLQLSDPRPFLRESVDWWRSALGLE